MKVQDYCSLQPPLEYNEDQKSLGESRSLITFLTNMEVIGTLRSSRLVLEWKAGNELPGLSRLEFSETFSVNNFALSDLKGNTSWSFNRIITDLPLLRTLLVICQRLREPTFWEMILFVL